jgi:prevent-host-death family protein
MTRVRPSSDIRPLSEFRANAAALVRHVQGTKRPLVLTQRGRSAAVLLDVEAYDALVEQVEVLRCETRRARSGC